jgi:Uma2 family endonuclease
MSVSSSIGQYMPVAMPPEPVCRLSVAQYHEMIAAGILTSDDPLELLEGWLVPKMVKHPPHSTARQFTTKALERIAPPGWLLRSQEPITLSDSEPEPDVAVVRGDLGEYEHSHPGPQDVALVVEVADASIDRDRSIKNRGYARAGIPVYWIVNLQERQVEVYTVPSGPAETPDYRQHEDYAAGSEVPLVVDGGEAGHISVAVLLPANG